jgi:hypothetical protein
MSYERWINNTDKEKSKTTEKKLSQIFLSTTVSQGLTWDQTRDIVVTLQQLTAPSLHDIDTYYTWSIVTSYQSQWPRGLRRRSSAARLLRLWVREPPGAWTFVCCECCVLSSRGLCDGLISRSEEPYRLWRVVVWNQETSKMRRLKPAIGLWKYN